MQGKGIELLPGVLQHQVKTGKLTEFVTPSKAIDISTKPDVHVSQGPILPSLLARPPADRVDNANAPKASFLETPSKFGQSILSSILKVGSHGPPSQPIHLFDDDNTEKAVTPESGLVKNLKFHEFTPRTNRHINSSNAASLSTIERSSSRVPRNSRLRNYQSNKVSSERVQKVFLNESVISNKQGLLTDSVEKLDKNVSAKRVQPDTDRLWIMPSNDSMDFSWR